MNRFFLIFLSFSVLLTSYCTTPKQNVENLKKCKFSLNSFQMKDVAMQGFPPIPRFTILGELRIENPNRSSVTLYPVDLNLSVITPDREKPTYLADIKTLKEIQIAGGTAGLVEVSIRTQLDKNLDANLLSLAMYMVSELIRDREVELLIEGNVVYKSILGDMTIPISQKTKASWTKKEPAPSP